MAPCMWGRATLAMVVSSACMMVASITDRVMKVRRETWPASSVAAVVISTST
ncbi:hypothetical protein D3C84_1097460 [compost metagenome]